MGHLPERADSGQTGAVPLPWVERAALAFIRGERIGFAERDRDEVVAILGAVVELLEELTRRRPCAKRRAA